MTMEKRAPFEIPKDAKYKAIARLGDAVVILAYAATMAEAQAACDSDWTASELAKLPEVIREVVPLAD